MFLAFESPGTCTFASSESKPVDHGDGRLAEVPQRLNGVVPKPFSNHFTSSTCEFGDVGPATKAWGLARFPSGGGLGMRRRPRAPRFIGRFHPIAHGLERHQHIGVQGIQFVRTVDGHAGDESEVVLFADRMQFQLHDVALWGVHGPLKVHLFLMSSPPFNEAQPRYDNSKRNPRFMAGSKEPMVSAVDMAKKYGDFIALHPLNVEVHAGEFFGVFGPNGAGKSTFIKLLTGQLRPSKGRIEVLGVDASKTRRRSKPTLALYRNRNRRPRSSRRQNFLSSLLAFGALRT